MSKRRESSLDDVMNELGQFNTYQLRLFLILLPFNLSSSFYIIFVMFLNQSPSWYCNDPVSKGSKWNQLCEEDWAINILLSIAFVGAMFGSYFFGYFADKYGRMPMYLFGVVSLEVLSLCLGVFYGNYCLFAVYILLCGFSMQGTYQVSFVLLLEFVGQDKRTLISTLITLCGTLGYILTPLVAFLVPNHRVLYLSLSVVYIGILLTYSLVPESPRWLLLTRQHSKLKALLDQIATINGTQYSTLTFSKLSSHGSSTEQSTCLTSIGMFTKPIIRSRIYISSFVWFVVCSSYYGLSYSAKLLDGSIHMNVFLGGVVEFPSIMLAYLLLQYKGRRISLAIMTLIISFCTFGSVLSSFFNFERELILFTLSAKCFVSGTFLILYIYTLELLPTSVRTIGLGVCSVFARIGGISVPVVLAALPDRIYVFLYFSVITLLAVLVLLLLPETRGIPMPDSIEQLISQETYTSKISSQLVHLENSDND
ncbi:Solute carrier family 22 member 5 [Oopsacas minuta]|uniref:Solute carrier family 22 member 5 n=1 Tax=Oopsacas minuta TaxID=111878 RepID=A0AAV7K276_9METZ|nr:Solute carrier family 22 member 5 [Oopsacas minuta]